MQLNKANFTLLDLKQLLREVFHFDYEKHKGEIELHQFTIVEWYKSDILKRQICLNNSRINISERYKTFQAAGTYFQSQKSIAIFFQQSAISLLLEYKRFTLEELILYYIEVLFHELEHHYQYDSRYETRKSTEINLFDFTYDMEHFLIGNNCGHYQAHHDEYWKEIDSNLYGVNRTYIFIKSKGLMTKKIDKNLQKQRNKYLFALNNYDIHDFLHELHKIVRDGSKVDINNYWYLWLLYENNNHFSSIDDITYCADKLGIDEEVLKYFFSSKDFLESLDFKSLSLENKQVIISAIKYALKIEINRDKKNREFLQNRQITLKQYLISSKKAFDKITYFNKKLDELIMTMELSSNEKVKVKDDIKGNIKEWRRPFDAGGTWFKKQKSLAVFFLRSEMLSFLDYTKFSLEKLIIFYVIGTFHELGHRYQDEFMHNITKWEEINLNAFSYDIDYFVLNKNYQHYEEHHEEYLIEIDANLYGVERAYNFFKSKGMLTKEIEELLQKHKNQYLFDSNNYDIHYFLHECHKIVKKIIGTCLHFVHFSVYFIMIIVDLGLLIKF